MGILDLMARVFARLRQIGSWSLHRPRAKPLEELYTRLEQESEALVKKKIDQFNRLHEQ